MKKIFALIMTILMLTSMISAFAAEESFVIPFDTSWKIESSSTYKHYSIDRAFDNDPSTYWHTNYVAEGSTITSQDECPHTITVDFGKELTLSGWIYTPRTDNATGMFHSYNLYASNDGVKFELFHKGKLPYPGGVKAPQKELFEAKKMRAIKIEATDSTGGFGTCAELQFLTSDKSDAAATEKAADENVFKYDSSWNVSATSNYKGMGIERAFDGDAKTYWHSNYTAEGGEITSKDELPISVIVDFGKNVTLGGWAYAPRTDNGTGMFKKYNIYASKDGQSFTLIHSASIPYPAGERVPQVASFPKTEMRAIKIEATEASAGFATAVEIWFYKNNPDFITANFDGTPKGSAGTTTTPAETPTTPEVKPAETTVSKGTASGAVTGEGKNQAGLSYLDRTGWTVSGESFKGNPPEKTMDGNPVSHWHSNYDVVDGTVTNRRTPPYVLEYTLPSATLTSGITLQPRTDMGLGRILKLNIYAKSADDGEYVMLYEGLEFDKTADEKEIPFTSNLKVKNIKLEILESAQSFGTLGEFNLWEKNPDFKEIAIADYMEAHLKDKLYKIDNAEFTATYDGENWSEHTPDKVFDGLNNFWQTETVTEYPVTLRVDLGKAYGVKEIVYIPRQSTDCHGSWGKVSVYTSLDGENWSDLVVGKTLTMDTESKKFIFDTETEIRFIDFEIEEARASRVSCAEIEFYQSKDAYDKFHVVKTEKYELKIGSNVIRSEINGEAKEKTIDVVPYIVNGSTLIPLRGLVEEMGAEIAWDGETKSITLKVPGKTITLQIWNNLVYVKDNKLGDIMYTLLNFPVIKDSRTFIPVRFVSEQLGYNVAWDGAAQTVTITK